MTETTETPTPPLYTLEFYKTTGGWRWRLKSHKNKKIVGASSESYRNGKECVGNFFLLTGFSLPEGFRLRGPKSLNICLGR